MKTIPRIAALALAALALLGPGAATGAAQTDWTMYVGTYNRGDSEGIYSYKLQASNGKLTRSKLAGAASNASYLAVHPNGRFLYSVNENDAGMVSSYAIDPATGKLKLLNSVSSMGSGPCHVAVDRAGQFLYAANYNDGIAAAFKIRPDGRLSEATAVFQPAGRSAHAHMAAVSPDNRFVWIVDLGLDRLMSYKIDPATGMEPNTPPSARVAAGTGPRHMVFGKDARFAYVVGETASSVVVHRYDAAEGTMAGVQTISTLPAGYAGKNTCAEIRLHPSGMFLYASNRGHDSIAVYRVDAANGTLTSVGYVPSGGQTPRGFAIDPSGNFLVAANQQSNNLVVFRIDQATGNLTPTGGKLEVDSPVDVLFVPPAGAK